MIVPSLAFLGLSAAVLGAPANLPRQAPASAVSSAVSSAASSASTQAASNPGQGPNGEFANWCVCLVVAGLTVQDWPERSARLHVAGSN